MKMKPLFPIVVTILALTVTAHPDNIEQVKELPQTLDPVVEAEESDPQARVERCTTCATNLKLRSPKDVLAAIQALPGSQVHTQESFESCTSEKGCFGLKKKDGAVVERFGNEGAFRAAAEADTNNEFTFHPVGFNFEAGLSADNPFWWMNNENSPFKNTGDGNFEKFSKSSSSFSTSGSGGNIDLSANPFLNGAAGLGGSSLSAGFTSSGAQSKPNTFQSSSFESSSFSSSNDAADISKNPFLNQALGANAGASFNGQSSFSEQSFASNSNANKFSNGGYTGSSPRPFTNNGANVNLIQNNQKTNEFDFEQQTIDEGFRNTGNVLQNKHSGSSHSGGELQQTCSGQGYVCVPKSQCNNGVVSYNGVNLVQPSSQKQYCHVNHEICCRIGENGFNAQGSKTQGSGLFVNSQSSSSQNGFEQTGSFGQNQNSGFGQSSGSFGASSNSNFGANRNVNSGAFGSGTSAVNRGVTVESSSFESKNQFGSKGQFGGSTVAPVNRYNGNSNGFNEVFKSTSQSNFAETDTFSSGSQNTDVYRPGAIGSGLKPGIPYLPPVDSSTSNTNIVSSTAFTTRPFSTPRPTPPRPFVTPRPPFVPSTTAPTYLPPVQGESSNTKETRLPPNPVYTDGSLYLDVNIPASSTFRPVNNLPSDIPAGCAAALKCTPIEFCTADGVISNTTVILSRDQEAYRVPLTDCKSLETGRIGKCCRDPLYSDPWPVNQLGKWVPNVFGGNDGKYVPDSRGSSNNIRPSVSVRPPVNGGILLSPVRPGPTSRPKLSPNQIPVTVSPTLFQKDYTQTSFTKGGQGVYTQQGQGQYSQSGVGVVSNQGSVSQGQGAFQGFSKGGGYQGVGSVGLSTGQGFGSQGFGATREQSYGQGVMNFGSQGTVRDQSFASNQDVNAIRGSGFGTQQGTAITREQSYGSTQGLGVIGAPSFVNQGSAVTREQSFGSTQQGVGVRGFGSSQGSNVAREQSFGSTQGVGVRGFGSVHGSGLTRETFGSTQGLGVRGFGSAQGSNTVREQSFGSTQGSGVRSIGSVQGSGLTREESFGSTQQGLGIRGFGPVQGSGVTREQSFASTQQSVGVQVPAFGTQQNSVIREESFGSTQGLGVNGGFGTAQGSGVSSFSTNQQSARGRGSFGQKTGVEGVGFNQGSQFSGVKTNQNQGFNQNVNRQQVSQTTKNTGFVSGNGQAVSQGVGFVASQNQGQGVRQNTGFGINQSGFGVSQSSGQSTNRGSGFEASQNSGQASSQGVGFGVNQGVGFGVTQGSGQRVSQSSGFGVTQNGFAGVQDSGFGSSQGVGQFVSQEGGSGVNRGSGFGVSQGGGSQVQEGAGFGFSTSSGQAISQGSGQGISQGSGQGISQGFGFGLSGQTGQEVSQGQGFGINFGVGEQGFGIRGNTGFGLQGQALRQEEVKKGVGQFEINGNGQRIEQGFGQKLQEGGVNTVVTQGVGQGVKQGQGFTVIQGGGANVENEFSESIQRVFLKEYNSGGQCGLLNSQKPYGNRNDLEVDFAEIPWQAMVLLQTNKSLLCGGVITRPDVVITTAACVEGLKAENVLIKGGEWKLGIDDEPQPFQIVQVKHILKHPQYKSGNLKYDAAILVLSENLRFAKNIYPICLPGREETLDAFYNGAGECIVTGWGKIVLQAHLQGAIMHGLNLSLINPEECQNKLSSDYPHLLEDYSEDSCVCGQPTNPTNNICKVDVGSALACSTDNQHYVLRGIYSWESGCQVGNQVAGFYKFDLEWYQWAIGIIESVRFAQYTTTTKITTNKYTSQLNSGVKTGQFGVQTGQYSGVKGGVKGSSTFGAGSKTTVNQFGNQYNNGAIGGSKDLNQFGQGFSGFSQFGASKYESSSSNEGSGVNFDTQLKGPVSNSYSATYSEKKVYQSEPKIITYTTKPEIVTFTTKPEYFTYTTKPKIVTYTTKPEIVTFTTKPEYFTYTTKPKIVTYTTKPQIIRYETSGSVSNPQYVAPGVTFNPSFSDLVGHKHNSQCHCLEGK